MHDQFTKKICVLELHRILITFISKVPHLQEFLHSVIAKHVDNLIINALWNALTYMCKHIYDCLNF